MIVVLVLICICMSSVDAKPKGAKDDYFSPHELCEYEISKAEQKYSVPNRLLMAIGTVESGRKLDGDQSSRPWPWTVCAKGKSYYLSTKSAAIAMVKRLMGRGIRNIDVGCMQVNLLHHNKAFKDLEEAFTPKNNVDYAAKFFTQLQQTYKSWTHAVGYYHSKAAKFYKPYCAKVYAAWTSAKAIDVPAEVSPKIVQAAAEVPSKISYMPSYYALRDRDMLEKLHKLGRQSLSRKAPDFFTKRGK